MPFSLRRSRLILALSVAVVVGLGALGLHVEDHLQPTSLDVPGTQSAQAGATLHRYFGDSAPFAILLQ